MEKKDIALWVDRIAEKAKEANKCEIEITLDTMSMENHETGWEESVHTGKCTIIMDLYFADMDKVAELYARCQSKKRVPGIEHLRLVTE